MFRHFLNKKWFPCFSNTKTLSETFWNFLDTNTCPLYTSYLISSAYGLTRITQVDYYFPYPKVEIGHKNQQVFNSQKRWRQILYFVYLSYRV